MPEVTRYAIVGTGSRSNMYFRAVTEGYVDRCVLVALCDTNQTRMDFYSRKLTDAGRPAAPTFKADRFDEMVASARPDVVIVTTRDCDHDRYIVRAMELGCDVITEKPMTTDENKCARVLETIERTGRTCTVTFNARYGPKDGKVKELLADRVIGDVLSVDYAHLLDIDHGADYFRRWHREKRYSGGLMVHKCTHCFDLVNWWVDSTPEVVYATGGLDYYGASNGNAPAGAGVRCSACDAADRCRFHWDASRSEKMVGLYLSAEHEDGYFRDACVFSDAITTEDNVAVNVRYASGAKLSYSLIAFAPYEGSHIHINGTTGRIEFREVTTAWETGEGGDDGTGELVARRESRIIVYPQFADAYEVQADKGRGGHGGADTRIVDALFGDGGDDPLGRAADHFDGARSILVGVAANRSMETGRPVRIDDLVKLPGR